MKKEALTKGDALQKKSFSKDLVQFNRLETQCTVKIQREMIHSFHSREDNVSFTVVASATRIDLPPLFFKFQPFGMAWDLQYLEVRKKDLVSTFGFPLSIMSHNFYVSRTLRLLVSLGSQVFLPLRSLSSGFLMFLWSHTSLIPGPPVLLTCNFPPDDFTHWQSIYS